MNTDNTGYNYAYLQSCQNLQIQTNIETHMYIFSIQNSTF